MLRVRLIRSSISESIFYLKRSGGAAVFLTVLVSDNSFCFCCFEGQRRPPLLFKRWVVEDFAHTIRDFWFGSKWFNWNVTTDSISKFVLVLTATIVTPSAKCISSDLFNFSPRHADTSAWTITKQTTYTKGLMDIKSTIIHIFNNSTQWAFRVSNTNTVYHNLQTLDCYVQWYNLHYRFIVTQMCTHNHILMPLISQNKFCSP